MLSDNGSSNPHLRVLTGEGFGKGFFGAGEGDWPFEDKIIFFDGGDGDTARFEALLATVAIRMVSLI